MQYANPLTNRLTVCYNVYTAIYADTMKEGELNMISEAMMINREVESRCYLTKAQTLYMAFRDRGYGVRETARRCGVSAATVSRTLKTADRKLKEWSEANENNR